MLEGFIEVSSILRCGVYALMREGVVVYVGQSKRMLTRIEAHRSQWARSHKAPDWLPIKGILFDRIYILPCRVEDMNRIEREMIDLYRPRYNVKLKAPTYVSISTPLNLQINGMTIPFNHARPNPRFERRL